MDNVRFVKRVDYTKMWKGKDGKERPSVRFYSIVNLSGKEVWLAFEPTKFSFSQYDLISEIEVIRENSAK